jgi:hypothetical protein
VIHRFTPTEIKEAIFSSSSSPRKAPGPDSILFLCIQRAYHAVPGYFHSLFSTLGSAGYHPQCWRQTTTVIIPKPNKPDYTNPKAYRPVALLNFLGKILEKLMATRLAYLAEAYNLLHEDQIGGRRYRCSHGPHPRNRQRQTQEGNCLRTPHGCPRGLRQCSQNTPSTHHATTGDTHSGGVLD